MKHHSRLGDVDHRDSNRPRIVFSCTDIGRRFVSGPEKIFQVGDAYVVVSGDGIPAADPLPSFQAALDRLMRERVFLTHVWCEGVRREARFVEVIQTVQGWFVRENREIVGAFESFDEAVAAHDLLCVGSDTDSIASRAIPRKVLQRKIVFDDSFTEGRWFELNGEHWTPTEETIRRGNEAWRSRKDRRPALPKRRMSFPELVSRLVRSVSVGQGLQRHAGFLVSMRDNRPKQQARAARALLPAVSACDSGEDVEEALEAFLESRDSRHAYTSSEWRYARNLLEEMRERGFETLREV